MKVRAKKSLGQHFLTDLSVAQRIAASLVVPCGAGAAVSGGEGCRKGSGSEGGEVVTVRSCDLQSSSEGAAHENRPTAELRSGKTDVLEVGPGTGSEGAAHENRPAAELRSGKTDVLEVGPGTGVLTQYLLQRDDIALKMVELDREAVNYLLATFPQVNGSLIEADFLHLRLENLFAGNFCIIGNFPYNISSQIFFKVLDYRDRVPQVVCMIQKEVAERIAEKPGSKTYGILSVLLQAWYDIEYLFSVGPAAFRPAPKVNSAVIRLTRNSRTSLGCDERLFKTVVKTAFNQRRKTLRNSLKSMILEKVAGVGFASVRAGSGDSVSAGSSPASANPAPAVCAGSSPVPDSCQTRLDTETALAEAALAEAFNQFTADPIFDLRPEKLSVEDFIALTLRLTP